MNTTTTPRQSEPGPARTPFYRRRGVLIGAAIVAIPAIALAWWLVSPLFLDTVVDEAFPTASAPATNAEPSASTAPIAPPPAATTPTEAGSERTAPAPGAQAAPPAAAADPAVEPILLRTGEFAGADDFHQSSGTASIYELEDGSRVLRFEDFEVTNGPDLHVLISPTETVDGREDLESAGYVDLGKLKGNVGSQNYELPADFDLDGPVTITIYCDPFHVVFATSTLGAAS